MKLATPNGHEVGVEPHVFEQLKTKPARIIVTVRLHDAEHTAGVTLTRSEFEALVAAGRALFEGES